MLKRVFTTIFEAPFDVIGRPAIRLALRIIKVDEKLSSKN